MNTQILPIEDPGKDESYVRRAAEILRAGGLVIIPTETVYGLAANVSMRQKAALLTIH